MIFETGASILGINYSHLDTVLYYLSPDTTTTYAINGIVCGQGNEYRYATVSVKPGGGVHQITDSICTGSTYNFNGRLLSVSGFYTDTLSSTDGCDSIVYLTLKVNLPPAVSWPGGADTIAGNVGNFTLSGGLPPGGIYSGAGVASNVFNPQTAGPGTHIITYSATDMCGKDSTSRLFVVITTGIEDNLENKISIYPNPTTGGWHLSADKKLINSPLEIYNATGQLIYKSVITSEQYQIDVPTIASGMYWLRITTQYGIVVRKLVKI